MSGLLWKLNRLQTMSPREVVWRAEYAFPEVMARIWLCLSDQFTTAAVAPLEDWVSLLFGVGVRKKYEQH